MSIEELLKPRYKVIADYPGCPYEIGTVLFVEQDGELYSPTCGYTQSAVKIMLRDTDRFKHLIKKLEWWEDMKREDVPDYLKTNPENARAGIVVRVYEVKEFVDGLGVIHSDLENPEQYFSKEATPLKYFLPATREEFDQYNNYKAKKDGTVNG